MIVFPGRSWRPAHEQVARDGCGREPWPRPGRRAVRGGRHRADGHVPRRARYHQRRGRPRGGSRARRGGQRRRLDRRRRGGSRRGRCPRGQRDRCRAYRGGLRRVGGRSRARLHGLRVRRGRDRALPRGRADPAAERLRADQGRRRGRGTGPAARARLRGADRVALRRARPQFRGHHPARVGRAGNTRRCERRRRRADLVLSAGPAARQARAGGSGRPGPAGHLSWHRVRLHHLVRPGARDFRAVRPRS